MKDERIKGKLGFIYFEDESNGETNLYISPLLKTDQDFDKNGFISLFEETLKKEYDLQSIDKDSLTSIWSNNEFIVTDQFNYLMELTVDSDLTNIFSLADTSEFENFIKIEADIDIDVQESANKKNKEESTTPPRRYNLHPHATYVGCRTRIFLGRFNSQEACNRAGRARYGRNGNWCCLLDD